MLVITEYLISITCEPFQKQKFLHWWNQESLPMTEDDMIIHNKFLTSILMDLSDILLIFYKRKFYIWSYILIYWVKRHDILYLIRKLMYTNSKLYNHEDMLYTNLGPQGVQGWKIKFLFHFRWLPYNNKLHDQIPSLLETGAYQLSVFCNSRQMRAFHHHCDTTLYVSCS